MNINMTNENVMEGVSVLRLPIKEKEIVKSKDIIYTITKRLIDILGAAIGVVLLIPLTIGIFVAKIITKDKGPIFYTQERIGKDGKLFKMYKFRSMVIGADDILNEYLKENKEAREEYKINKKLKDDPRVTKIGKIIRKTSIDEFPQFINVLKGDMSLVGPRPYLYREIEDIGEYYPYIIAVKPGITGLWQVSGRNETSFKERLELDLEYYKKRNMKLYIKILSMTVKKVIFKEGAI